MRLTERYGRLTLWNKLAVWGAVASIIGIPLALTNSTIIFDRIADADRVGGASPSASPAGESKTDQTTGPRVAPDNLSLSQFFDRQAALDGRFMELQEFMDSLRGREVVWRGYVAHVQDGYLRIQVARDNPRGAWVTLGSTWRTKLFSLRQGDLVEIRGRFRSGNRIWANVDGSSVVVVEPKSR